MTFLNRKFYEIQIAGGGDSAEFNRNRDRDRDRSGCVLLLLAHRYQLDRHSVLLMYLESVFIINQSITLNSLIFFLTPSSLTCHGMGLDIIIIIIEDFFNLDYSFTINICIKKYPPITTTRF